MAKILENQLFEGKSWHGFTDKNHLMAAFDFDPINVNEKLIQISDVNFGEDVVSMVMKHGTHRIPQDKDVERWKLENIFDENYELLGAFEDAAMARPVGTTAGYKAGANGTDIYLLFSNKPFNYSEIIVGMKPDLYRLWVIEDPRNVGGDRFLYKVQLITNDSDYFVPNEELAEGTRWSSDGGLQPDSLSYDGFDIDFQSHAMMEARLSSFRVKHEIPGRMFKVKPMYGFVKGKDGKARQYWITNVEYELLRKVKHSTASIVMYGHSNVKDDGTITNIDKNGYTATSAAGWKQQWASTNLHTWNLVPDLDTLTNIAMDAVVNKVSMGNRKMIIKAGEYGLIALSKMVQTKLGASAYQAARPYLGDNTGRAYKWSGNDLKVNLGQIMGVAVINGIEFTFVVDPSKDDSRRNKLYHPLGGLASSYEYDIMGFGTMDETANMQIMRRENEEPIFGALEGMRGFFAEKASSFSNPKMLSHSTDASTIHYMDPGIGGIVWDPTKIVRYYPELTQS